MKLNTQQQKELIQRLNQVWRNKECEICSNNNWLIDDTVFEIREFHGKDLILGSGAIKPLLSMTCSQCGNTKFLNAIQLGIIAPDTDEEKTKRKEV